MIERIGSLRVVFLLVCTRRSAPKISLKGYNTSSLLSGVCIGKLSLWESGRNCRRLQPVVNNLLKPWDCRAESEVPRQVAEEMLMLAANDSGIRESRCNGDDDG